MHMDIRQYINNQILKKKKKAYRVITVNCYITTTLRY